MMVTQSQDVLLPTGERINFRPLIIIKKIKEVFHFTAPASQVKTISRVFRQVLILVARE